MVIISVAGMGAYRAYGSYENGNISEQQTLLVAENVLALSEGPGPKFYDPCWLYFSTMTTVQCKHEETNSSSNSGVGVSATVLVNGVPVTVGGKTGTTQSYNNTRYDNREKHVCESSLTNLDRCWKKDQKYCNGDQLVENC